MAALGDILRIIGWEVAVFHNLSQGVGSTGNGPISNAAPFLASVGSVINVTDRGGGAVVRRAIADSSGIWQVYDLQTGPYLATELGAARQWEIDVAADLSFTVTPVTSSFPRTRAYASA